MLYRAGFASAMAVAALACAPIAAQAADCGTIEIGAAVSLTGKYASNGTNTKNGYEFAVKKINDAGGVKIGGKCYHFKIKYYDDELTPARAAQLVERLIDQDKIKYILGPYGSPVTKAVLPVVEKYKTPLVQSEAASRSLFTQGYKYSFGIIATSEKYLAPAIDMAAALAKQHGKKPSDVKVAMIYQDDAFSLDVRAGVVDAIKKDRMKTVDRRPHAAGPERHHRLPDQGEGAEARRAAHLRPREGRGDGAPPNGRAEGPGPAGRHDPLRVRQGVAGFPEGRRRDRLPDSVGRDHEGERPDVRDRGPVQRANEGRLQYKVVPYQVAQARAAVYVWRTRSSEPIRSTRRRCVTR